MDLLKFAFGIIALCVGGYVWVSKRGWSGMKGDI